MTHHLESWTPLYHWSPTAKRAQVIRHGLKPGMKSNTSTWRAPYICFTDSPAWSWALSAGMAYTPHGMWDCWMTYHGVLVAPDILPSLDRPSGVHEVRTKTRVYKQDLWLVGSRSAP